MFGLVFAFKQLLFNKYSLLMVPLKTTFRHLFNQKFSALINIFGLAIGIGSFILISLYVYDAYLYDRMHEQGDRIYRINSNAFNPNQRTAQLPARLYPYLTERVPEVEKVTRLFSSRTASTLHFGDYTAVANRDLYVDPAFMEMFSFELLAGDLHHFSEHVAGALLDQTTAKSLFGEVNPIGEVFYFTEQGHKFEFIVSGVVADVPKHSHLQFNVLFNMEYMRSLNTHMFEDWGNYAAVYYVMLTEDAEPQDVADKIHQLYGAVGNARVLHEAYFFHMQPLRDIYLGSADIRTSLLIQTGNKSTVFIFSVSALLLLVLACLNYINLSSARAIIRSREVGVRKVLGASRNQLIRLFLFESFLVSLVALLIGYGLAELFMPAFSHLSGRELSMNSGGLGFLLVVLPGLWILVSLFSGIYPAFVLSRFSPADVLKGSAIMSGVSSKGKGLRIRQLLIVAQFAISIGLMASSLVLFQQTSHVLKQSGFNKESLIVVRNEFSGQMTQVYNAFRNEMEQYPFVTHISSGTNVPTVRAGNQGRLRQPHTPPEESGHVYLSPVDFGYFETLGAKMIAGRDLDVQFATDSTEAVVLNATAARNLGVMDSLGVVLTGFWDGHDKRLVGIVEDIHFQSAHESVMSTAFFVLHEMIYQPPASYYMLVRFKTRNLGEVTDAIERAWDNASVHGNPAHWFFMDERYENLYREELQTGQLSRILTLLAIVIACMGLIGTASYVMESRRKEFGIRKVLGASVVGLARMVSMEFALLILLSCIIAWPLSYYFMDRWLGGFAYRIDLSIWYFVMAGLAGLLLALAVINTLTLNQSRKNVLDSLRHE